MEQLDLTKQEDSYVSFTNMDKIDEPNSGLPERISRFVLSLFE